MMYNIIEINFFVDIKHIINIVQSIELTFY